MSSIESLDRNTTPGPNPVADSMPPVRETIAADSAATSAAPKSAEKSAIKHPFAEDAHSQALPANPLPSARKAAARAPLASWTERTVDSRTLLLITVALYVAFCAVRIALTQFPKAIDVMPDELRYLDLARSLSTDGTLTMRGDAATFQKILYPLFLFPAMMFHDTLMQVKAIGVLNALYVCSAVFPTYLFGKRIFGKRLLPNVTALLLVLLMPDMCYSMTFMSESLFFPLALWLAYLLWRTLCCDPSLRRYPALCLASGVSCYAVYLCKEVAAAYAIAFLLVLALLAIRKRQRRSEAVMGAACFLVGFLAPFVLMKATLFAGMGNSYNQMDPSILLSPYTWAFGIYALVTDFTYLIAGFCFFCLVFPLLGWRKFPRNQKRLLAFALLAIGIGLLVVVYTISIREDVGHVALRQHLRYVIPLFIPLMMLFMEQVHQQDLSAWKRNVRSAVLLVSSVGVSCLLVATMFGSANLAQGFDNSQFHLLREFQEAFEPMDQQRYDAATSTLTDIDNDEELLEIQPGIWLARAGLIALILGGSIGLTSRRKRETYLVIMAVIFACCLGNNWANIKYNHKAYEVKDTQVSDVVKIDEFLDALPEDAKVLIVNDTARTQMNNLTDTYIQNRRMTYRYCTDTAFANDCAHGFLNQADIMGNPALTGDQEYLRADEMAKDMAHIDYILINRTQDITFNSTNVQNTHVTEGDDFTLYRVTDGRSILADAQAPDNS